MINILSTKSYNYLKKNLLKSGHFNDIGVETKTFPDGERYFRILNPEQISGNPAVYICGTVDDAAIWEAYNVCCTLVREGCSSLHLIIPYFGYSRRQNNPFKPTTRPKSTVAYIINALRYSNPREPA